MILKKKSLLKDQLKIKFQFGIQRIKIQYKLRKFMNNKKRF